MAGPATTHRASHAIFQRIQDAFHRRQLVEASVDILGHTFRTSIREGASTEELIEKVAKENGGGVARVYYPEFRTWEIVAVKIGGQLLVKGDPKRVAEADFSQFSEPDAVREAALISSRKSDGGIHFSIGSSGIPLAVTPDQGIVFPNAEELRIGKATRNISLWMTSVNINPRSIADLDRAYSGGVSVSEDALKKIAESHGGVRSDRLLLDDNILVLNKDTGEILTGSQHAMRMESISVPAEHYAPPPIQAPDIPALPFDGSVARAQFLSFRVFDGSLRDQVRVQFSPLPQQAAAPRLAPSTPETAKSREREAGKPSPLRFSIIEFSSIVQPSAPAEAAREKVIAGKAPEMEHKARSSGPARREPLPSAEMIMRSWLKSRKPPAALGVPDQVLPASAAEAPRPRRRKKRYRIPPAGSRGPEAQAQVAPKADKPRPSATWKKTEMRPVPGQREPAMKRKKPDSRLKPGPARAEKAKRTGKGKSIRLRLHEMLMAARKIPIKEKGSKKQNLAANDSGNRKIPKAPGHTVLAKPTLSKKESPGRPSPPAVRKRAKRKMARHFFLEMMGLFQRKRRGRKFSTKNARAE